MVTTVRTRPNHYETLGISPTASSEEIVRAFAKEISVLRPRAFGGISDVSLAYETLRDPYRRRAYDESIGILPKPAPKSSTWAFPSTYGAYTQRAPVAHPKPQPQPPAESGRASFIAASLKELADPSPLGTSKNTAPPTEPTPKAEVAPTPSPEPRLDERPAPPVFVEPPSHVDAPVADWKRTGAIAGGLVAAVGVLGALAGLQAGDDIQAAQQSDRQVTVALPRPAPSPKAVPDPGVSMALAEEAPARPRRTTSVSRSRGEPVPQLGRALSDEEIAELAPVDVGQRAQPMEVASEQVVAETSPVEAVPASMPLPNKVVARTIQRIGYACGSVASTTALQGEAPGTFKVTCTSGHSYRAAPVRGRYHFRRLASQ